MLHLLDKLPLIDVGVFYDRDENEFNVAKRQKKVILYGTKNKEKRGVI